MKLPFELQTRDIELSDDVESDIRERAGRLDHFYDRIMRCRVTVKGPGAHHRKGIHKVQIDLTVPGAKIVITRQRDLELSVALKGAFHAAGRRLEDHVRKSRGFVKAHKAG